MNNATIAEFILAAQKGIDWEQVVADIAKINAPLVINTILKQFEPEAGSITSQCRNAFGEKGGFIAAIKLRRQLTGEGLLDAKTWIENTFPAELETWRDRP